MSFWEISPILRLLELTQIGTRPSWLLKKRSESSKLERLEFIVQFHETIEKSIIWKCWRQAGLWKDTEDDNQLAMLAEDQREQEKKSDEEAQMVRQLEE